MTIIGIITDFGMRGMHYIAEMKGVAYQINPDAQIVDISHSICPYSKVEAAYALFTVYNTFPKGTIFVCVVDPGVGSQRDIIALQTKNGYILIGPDNGIFTYFIQKQLVEICIRITETEFFYEPYVHMLNKLHNKKSFNNDLIEKIENVSFSQREVNAEFGDLSERISQIENEDLADIPTLSYDNIENVSNFDEISTGSKDPFSKKLHMDSSLEKGFSATFHGRDIMMPVAAHLSKGLDLFSLGELKENLTVLEDMDPVITEDRKLLTGLIQYIDDFGNIITNIPILDFQLLIHSESPNLVLIYEKHRTSLKYVHTFAGNKPDQLLFINGSSGFLEICINLHNAAQFLSAKVNTKFEIEIIGSVFNEFIP